MARKTKDGGSPDASTPDAGPVEVKTNDIIAGHKRRKKKTAAEKEQSKAERAARKAEGKKEPKRKTAKMTAREVERAMKAKEALEYRLQGYSYREIAQEMGYKSGASAHDLVREALADIPREAADEVRNLELDRLDMMQTRLMGLFMEDADIGIVDSILKIMNQRDKYLNLSGGKGKSPADAFADDMAKRFADAVAADKPILRPDGPLPANPVL